MLFLTVKFYGEKPNRWSRPYDKTRRELNVKSIRPTSFRCRTTVADDFFVEKTKKKKQKDKRSSSDRIPRDTVYGLTRRRPEKNITAETIKYKKFFFSTRVKQRTRDVMAVGKVRTRACVGGGVRRQCEREQTKGAGFVSRFEWKSSQTLYNSQ